HGADDEVGTGQGLRDLVLVRHLRRDRTGEGLVDLPQAGDVDVDDLDVRSEAQSHAGGVRAEHTGADHDDIRAFDPGHAGRPDAAAAAGLEQAVLADLGRPASGVLARWRQEREAYDV